MSEIDELENCSDPEEAKRLLAAFFSRRLREGTADPALCALLAEGIETGRMVFRKRRKRRPGEPFLVADLKDPVWWADRIIEIKEEE